jgi:glyoxylase-like metal-dependent hydrolase (beta-lactamase superfamily II)
VRHHPLFDPRTWTITWVVWDPATRDALVVDPVLDFDPASGRVWRESVDALLAYVTGHGLTVRAVIETHAHADHLSGGQLVREATGAPVMIGEHIRTVQSVFRELLDLGPTFPVDGSQFDRLLADGEIVQLGSIRVEVIHTPGHTPACVSLRIGDAVFVGDALFAPDYGVGRCDFPAGDAAALHRSVLERLYALPDDTVVCLGHDYQPGGRPLVVRTTIGEQKARNVQLDASTPRDAFVAMRTARDRTLDAPRLLYPSVQVNLDAGRLPAPAANGRRYLRQPVVPDPGVVPPAGTSPAA